MNPSLSLFRRLRIVAGLCGVALFAVHCVSAQSPVGTWTGLDKSIHRGQLHEITLHLQEATPEQAAVFPRVSAFSLPGLEKQILAGSMDFKIPNQRGNSGLRETREVLLGYFPEINLVSLYFRYGNRVVAHEMKTGVFDAQDGTMAFFHTGPAARDALPFVLQRGSQAPQDLQRLTTQSNSRFQAPANPLNVVQAAQQRKAAQRAAQESMKLQQELNQKYQPRIQALQQEMIAALQAGKHALAQEKQLEMQELALKVKAIQRGEIPVDELDAAEADGTTRTAAKPGSGCPEEVLAWIGELEANGESHREFSGLVRLGNFFRDAYFVPHFEKPFSDFSKQQGMKLSRDIQMRCLTNGSTLRDSAYVNTLGGIFMDSPQFNRFDALSTARALDTLASWQEQTMRSVEATGSLEIAKAFELIRSGITGALWPSEQAAAREQMAAIVANKVSSLVYSELEAILERLEKADTAGPLRELAQLSQGELASKIPDGQVEAFQEAFWIKVDPALERYLQRQLRAFGESKDGLASLVAGKRWHGDAGEALRFIGERPAYRDFVAAFAEQRQQAYDAAKRSMEKALEEITEKRAAVEFHWPFALKTDLAISATWRGLKALQDERIREIDWDAYLVRVGDGPFGPDYPGAVYLNAVYRGDLGVLQQEDEAYQNELLDFIAPLLNDEGFNAIGTLLSGGLLGEDFSLSDLFIGKVRETYAYDSLLACFVVNYYDMYGNCGGRPTVVIPVTTTTTLVQNFSDGGSLRTPISEETRYHDVLRDHSAAWRKFEGQYSSPEMKRFGAMLAKTMSPEGKEMNLQYALADTVEGMIKAMRQYPCDHDVIQRMEANLLDLSAGRSPSRRGAVDTSWKQ